jgi:hypothetical protein
MFFFTKSYGMSSISVVDALHSSAALWNWLPGNQDGRYRRKGIELMRLAPGNIEFVIRVIALSAFSRNGSSLDAIWYPYKVVMIIAAAILFVHCKVSI